MEKTPFEGWPNCIRLHNHEAELIVTTDVGPRIISFGFINGQNLLYVFPGDKGKKGGDAFRYYGGHRLWHAPEVSPRTYAPDNDPVKYEWNDQTLKLKQDIEHSTGIVKEIEINLSQAVKGVTVVTLMHRLINKNYWDIELAPWAITALAPGGSAILPQEPYIDPANYMLPSRPMVLWHYTQMDDPHWTWGKKYIQLKQNPKLSSEQKLGLLNKQKWCAYSLNGDLFIKTFDYKSDAIYTDYGCNNEVWADGSFLELESLGPYTKIAPQGTIEFSEKWLLTKSNVDNSEQSIDAAILPLIG